MIKFLNECFNKVIYKPSQNISISREEGLSGKKILELLSLFSAKLCDEDNVYLEVGVFRGLSLLSVAKCLNHSIAYGIDNFSQFDPKNENLSVVENKIKKNNLADKTQIINEDFEKALVNLDKYVDEEIGLYFIDGPHDYRSQMLCLLLAKKYLASNSIIIVDDCNYAHVRQANYDFLISHEEYKLVFEAYTSAHPKNMTYQEYNECVDGFWNGINIIIKDDVNKFKTMLPPLSNIGYYPNDHIIHSSRMPFIAPQAVNTINNIFHLRLSRAIKGFIGIYKEKVNKHNEIGRFDNMNTHSESLPKYNINEKLKI